MIPRPFVMMVTDRSRSASQHALAADSAESRAAVSAAAGTAARAGVDVVQVRERGLEDDSLLALTVSIRDSTAGTGARIVVNDRVDVALAAGAAGAHLPGRAVSCTRARAIVPAGFLLGRSVHSVDEAVAAEGAGGCDYLLFGTVFESRGKAPGHPVAGLEALARVCAAVRLPVLAIGGITVARVPEVAKAGAAGVAAIGLFAAGGESDVRETVDRIRLAFGGH